MTEPENRLDRSSYYKGVIHFHSRYSHDGHDAPGDIAARLNAAGIDFCVLTDHFEDFDAQKFQRYLAELEAVNSLQQTVVVPAIEAEFRGFHVIFLPVVSYEEIRSIVEAGTLACGNMMKILAHPTKHPMRDVAEFLRTQRLDGIELWNQQADGNYLPPADFFRGLIGVVPADIPAVFFGTDLHNAGHRINNLLLIPRDGELTSGLVTRRLLGREFINYNRNVARYLAGASSTEAIIAWFDELADGNRVKAAMRHVLKKYLKSLYHLLPRTAKVSVNDFKNAVKNRL